MKRSSAPTAQETTIYSKTLLANDPLRNAEFLFLMRGETKEADERWRYDMEERIHRRMFRPNDPSAGDIPVPSEVWLEAVDVTLTPLGNFEERLDLYSQDGGVDGKLDPEVWRAMGALYSTNVFFDMRGNTSYQVTGQAYFVVIEDLAQSGGDAAQSLLFIWEDIPVDDAIPKSDGVVAVETKRWGNVKRIYR